MSAILLKNFYFYKRNIGEMITQIVSSFIEVAPIYFMMIAKDIESMDIFTVLMNYLLAVCILNIVVNVSFEYYKEIIKEDAIDLKIAKIGHFKYAFAQTLFYTVLNMFLFIMLVLIISMILQVSIIPNITLSSLVQLLMVFILFLISVISLNSVLIIIVEKTKLFSMSSLLCNFILIIAGCYNPVSEFTGMIRILSFMNPFTYFVEFMKHFFHGSQLFMNDMQFYVSFITLTLLYFICFYLLKYKLDTNVVK